MGRKKIQDNSKKIQDRIKIAQMSLEQYKYTVKSKARPIGAQNFFIVTKSRAISVRRSVIND